MPEEFEYFVDATKAAEFLSLSRKHVLKLSKQGVIPAHPLGIGTRKTWRYLLSELRAYVLAQGFSGGTPTAASDAHPTRQRQIRPRKKSSRS